MDIVKGTLSDCVLSENGGYAVSEGAKQVTNFPSDLPFSLITNGLEIITERNIFHTGEGGLEDCICPNCNTNIASENWIFLEEWFDHKNNHVTCPNCHYTSEINEYTFSPQWGFSNLGFSFWNWPDLTNDFIDAFRQKLGCAISVVYTHI